jgi:NADPH2:quinone reductase
LTRLVDPTQKLQEYFSI